MQMDTGVQRETLMVRREMLGLKLVWRLATQGRHRLGLRRGERVGRPCIFSQRVEPRLEESADAALQGAQDLGHVVIGQAGKRHELDAVVEELALGAPLAAAALLHYAGEAGAEPAKRASRAVYESVFEVAAAGIRTPDLGGHAGTTEFTDEVISRTRAKLS